MSGAAPEPGEDVVDWAVRTRRLAASRAPHWRDKIAAGGSDKLLRAFTADRVPAPAPRAAARPSARAAFAAAAAGPGYEANPLVTAASTNDRAAHDAAAALGSAPTLFASGDLPPFTASGIDPSALAGVPWEARHPIAAAPADEAFAMLEKYSDPAQVDNVAMLQVHPGNVAYASRVSAWLQAAVPKSQARFAMWGDW